MQIFLHFHKKDSRCLPQKPPAPKVYQLPLNSTCSQYDCVGFEPGKHISWLRKKFSLPGKGPILGDWSFFGEKRQNLRFFFIISRFSAPHPRSMLKIVKFHGGLIVSSVFSRIHEILTSQLTKNGPKWGFLGILAISDIFDAYNL